MLGLMIERTSTNNIRFLVIEEADGRKFIANIIEADAANYDAAWDLIGPEVTHVLWDGKFDEPDALTLREAVEAAYRGVREPFAGH